MAVSKVEVLAPAGSPESLIAGVRAGADAVYLGASRFSARAGAKNFSFQELQEAVSYCHARGVKVYLAVNTLMLDGELPEALKLVKDACALPVDAVLVQDMGLAGELLSRAPKLRLHASTQTSVHTTAGTEALYCAGFKRVVLARELSLKEISDIHRECPIELEIFVHGALCMSVSGQCYFSSVFGSRSGNRGLCAQPCRLPFSAPGGTGHDLSLRDLSLIPLIGELEKAGATSLKIEGRLKRPEYVASAVRACRLSADGKVVPAELSNSLHAVFSRSGFTHGYADGKLGREMFGVRTRQDVTAASGNVLKRLRGIYASEPQRIPADFSFEAMAGQPARLSVSDGAGISVHVTGNVPETAVRHATDVARCEEQLRKTGGTPFHVRNIACKVGPGLTISVSELNRMRREALAKLESARAQRPKIPFNEVKYIPPKPYHAGRFHLRARFCSCRLPEAAKKCELVYVPISSSPKQLSELIKSGFNVAVEIPRGLFGLEKNVLSLLKMAKSAGVNDAWAGNLDSAAIALKAGFHVHGGFSLNITNTEALMWYQKFGLTDSELSFELKLSQAEHIGGSMKRGVIVYGRLPLMLCRNCPAANSPKGCLHCKRPPEITDRRNVHFPVMCSGACSEVLNSVPLYLADRLNDVKNQDFGLLRFSTESTQEAENILNEYFLALGGVYVSTPKDNTFTRGLCYRGFE